jgi:hypothetical protein
LIGKAIKINLKGRKERWIKKRRKRKESTQKMGGRNDNRVY